MTDVDTQDGLPAPKQKPRRSSMPIAIVAILAALAWGVFEYRQASLLTEALGKATAVNSQLQLRVTNQENDLKNVSAKLSELARRSLPISVIFRPTASGNGLTTFFKNNAPTPISIGVVLTNPITDRRREVNLDLPANGVQSIGEAEGWVFAPGHHIKVTHAEFGTVEYIVPDNK